MTSEDIQEQIRVIRLATEKASVSKEAARAFLREAGIIGPLDGVDENSSDLDGSISDTEARKSSFKK